MILAPFTFGAFRAVDQRELPPHEQNAVSLAIRDGIQLFPAAYACDALGTTFAGNYPVVRLGIYLDGVLVGGWWMGCCTTAPGHTRHHARIYTRVSPGPVPAHRDVFFKSQPVVDLCKHLLRSVLHTHDEGTLQIAGFDYAHDSHLNHDGPSAVAVRAHQRFVDDPDLLLTRTALAAGGHDIRVVLR